jgi:hypothetical protein
MKGLSYWSNLDIEDKITTILKNVKYPIANHPFGKPFMTVYQIAIEFKKYYPSEYFIIGKDIGGKGLGQKTSLAQYLANQLAIHQNQLVNIECGFLADDRLNELTFEEHGGNKIESSLRGSGYGVSIYRYIE